MHTDTIAVTTQSNKIVLNDVKDSQGLLEASYGKKHELTFWPTQLFIWGYSLSGYGHFSTSYNCRRNACFETIINCPCKPGKLLNLVLRRPNPIKCCMWTTKICGKIRGNQQYYIYV